MINLKSLKCLQSSFALFFCVFAILVGSTRAFGQTVVPPAERKNEVAFLAGLNEIPDRSSSQGKLTFDRNLHYQANYSRDVWGIGPLRFLVDVPVIYAPSINVSKNSPGDPAASYSSFLFLPGVRARFFPKRWYSPWVGAGYGWSTSSASSHLLDGAVNNQTRTASGKAWDYSGGLDLKLPWKHLSARAEVRDVYTTVPALALPQNQSRTRNLIFAAGVVYHF